VDIGGNGVVTYVGGGTSAYLSLSDISFSIAAAA